MKARLVLLLVSLLAAAHADAGATRYVQGDPADAQPALFGPAWDLQGGGPVLADAFQALVNQIRGCTNCAVTLDVVVLAAVEPAEGSPTPEGDVMVGLEGVDSVETITLAAPYDADDPDVERVVRAAEIVWYAGGNPCHYLTWTQSRVARAVEAIVARGGGVAGSSAGEAIQGEYVYDGCRGSVRTDEALRDPYDRYVSFAYDVFRWPALQHVVIDSHFVERDRFGRLMAFVARQIRDGRANAAWGVGVERDTAFVIDRNGLARVYGEGPLYVVLGDHMPELCEPRLPLTFSLFKIWRVPAGGTFDFMTRPTTGFYLRSVVLGVIDGNPY